MKAVNLIPSEQRGSAKTTAAGPAASSPEGSPFGAYVILGVLGLFLGRAIAPALLVAFLLGSVVGIGVMVVKGVQAGRKTAIPFGPFLALGGLVGLYAGDDMVDWYLDTFASS